jgi:zinc protease
VQERWRKYYKPANALVVLAGSVDAGAAREAIKKHFAGLPAGDRAPAPQEPGEVDRTLREVPVQAIGGAKSAEVCLAFRAPDPDQELYVPFLVAVARLQARAGKLETTPGRFPVQYAPLDDPAVLFLRTPLKKGETPRQAVTRLEAFVMETLKPDFGSNDVKAVIEAFGLFLGLINSPDPWLAGNPYGVAFSLGRRTQMGIDPAKLIERLPAMTDTDLRQAAKDILGADRHAAVVVRAQQANN